MLHACMSTPKAYFNLKQYLGIREEDAVKWAWMEPMKVCDKVLERLRPDARELDDKTVKKAKIVVDTKEGVLAESGDLIIPIEKGVISTDHIYAELGEVVADKKLGRVSDDEITCWKCVGLAIEDAATAKLVYEKAVKGEVGMEIEL